MTNKVIVTVSLIGTSFQLSSKDLISVEFGTTTRDDNCSLSFGVVEQNVSIKFYDRSRGVAALISSGRQIKGNIVVEEYDPNNTIINTDSYMINDVSLNDSHTEVTLKGIDSTFVLDNIEIPKSTISSKTVHQLLTTFFSYLPGYMWKYYDEETEAKATGIVTPTCWYRAGTLREFLDKVCVLGFLKIFYKNSIFYVMGGVV